VLFPFATDMSRKCASPINALFRAVLHPQTHSIVPHCAKFSDFSGMYALARV
jgi:hypothetical protein